jgi:uncharacterized protein YhaN
MKLKKIMLHRVGQYTENTVLAFKDGFNLVYGPNESGKSTFLAGFRGMLFGKVFLPEETVSTPAGAFGRMWLEDEAGQLYEVERALSKKSPPKVVFPDGMIRSGTSVLTDVFSELGQVEELLFRSVFTFQLSDLREAGKDDGLQKSIYGIHGLSQLNPAQIEAELDERGKAIFLPRKNAKKPLNQTLARLDEVLLELRGAHDRPDDYNRVKKEIKELNVHLTENEHARAMEEARYSFLRLVRNMCQLVRDWQALELKLQNKNGLPAYDARLTMHMDEIRLQLQELEKKRKQLQTEYTETMWKIEQKVVDDNLFAAESSILGLQQQIGAVNVEAEQIDKLMDRILQIADEQNEIKAHLSTVWTEERLTNVELSAARLEVIKGLHERFVKCQTEFSSINRFLQDKILDEIEARESFGIRNFEDVEAALHLKKTEIEQKKRLLDDEESRIEAFGSLVTQLDQLTRDFVSKEEINGVNRVQEAKLRDLRTNHMRILGWLSSLLFAVMAIWLLSSKQFFQGTVGFAFAVTVAFSTWLFTNANSRSQRTGSGRKQSENMSALEEKISAVNRQLESIEQHFSFVTPSSRTVPAWIDIKRSLARLRQQLQENMEELANHERALERWKMAIRQVSRAKLLQNQNKQEEMQILDEFSQVLSDLFGGPEFQLELPGFMKEAELVMAWRKLKQQEALWIRECDFLKQRVCTFCETAALQLSLLAGSPHLEEAESESASAGETGNTTFRVSQIGEWINHAVKEFERTKQIALERQELSLLASQQKQRIEEKNEEISILERKAEESFFAMSVTDWDGYWQVIEEIKAHHEMKQRAEAFYNELLVRCGGSRDKLEEAVQFLAGKTDEEMDDFIKACGEKVENLRQEMRGMIEGKALLKQQLKELETAKKTEGLMWQKASLQSTRDKLAFDWARLTTARMIARMARVSWEENNQPVALKWASSIFKEITGGKYPFVKSRMDVSGVPVLYCTDELGHAIDVRSLSRGAREQLYLALRLATIEMYRERHVRMPVILDDPMVNFDLDRTIRYFRILQSVARNHQFIFLTCHRQIVDLAMKVQEVNLIEL